MNLKVKGTILGIVSAVSYGTNPLGALFLYQEGLNSNSVLFYRFSLAAVVLACILFIQKQSFRLSRKEVKALCLLGILCVFSDFLYEFSPHGCRYSFDFVVCVSYNGSCHYVSIL